MKEYFLKLFGFDLYANQAMLIAIQKAGAPEKAVLLMAHLLSAQQIWLSRCQPDAGIPIHELWPKDWSVDKQIDTNEQNHAAWLDFLNSQNEDIFNSELSYTNSQGNRFQNTCADVLAHLINHGTHHRAQAGQVLKNNAFNNLPNTDYITYLRR